MAGWSVLGLLLMLILVVGILCLVSLPGSLRQGSGDDPAFEILRRRYAAGEITREEYDRKLRDLES